MRNSASAAYSFFPKRANLPTAVEAGLTQAKPADNKSIIYTTENPTAWRQRPEYSHFVPNLYPTRIPAYLFRATAKIEVPRGN
jgi:hypothetical protein